MTFDPTAYGADVADLLELAPLPPLGPGKPVAAGSERLRTLSAESLLAGGVVDRDMAQCCLSGLWLAMNELDESHTISQGIHTPSGSYWHAIMHRREPDYSNSKYWFRQTGNHPVFEALSSEAARLAAASGASQADFLTQSTTWDPFSFVDLCAEAARSGGELETLCREISQAEWRLLFDDCYRSALGK